MFRLLAAAAVMVAATACTVNFTVGDTDTDTDDDGTEATAADLDSARGAMAHGAAYQAGTTPVEIYRQMRRLPDDDIWWNINGPDMAWNFRNLQMVFPTVSVSRDGPVRTLTERPMPAIADYEIDTPRGRMRFEDFISSELSTTTGVVVLHRGEVVFERYPRMQPHEKPVYWSVAKAFVGTMVRLLEERGEVDVTRSMAHYIPELRASSFGDVSVRDVLDMATGLDCEDEYVDLTSCYYRYSMAIGDGFRTPDAPDDVYAFVANLRADRHAAAGERFSYSGVNTFVLAWLVETITGMPFQDAFARDVWTRIGAEGDAAYIAPRYGVPVTHGGFIARLRDVARFGLLFTPSYGAVADTRIVSEAHVRFLQTGGRPHLLANANAASDGVRHNIYQWDQVFEDGALFKGGWAGQGLYIHPDRDVVAVFTGYFKDDDYSETPLWPVLARVLEGVFGEG